MFVCPLVAVGFLAACAAAGPALGRVDSCDSCGPVTITTVLESSPGRRCLGAATPMGDIPVERLGVR